MTYPQQPDDYGVTEPTRQQAPPDRGFQGPGTQSPVRNRRRATWLIVAAATVVAAGAAIVVGVLIFAGGDSALQEAAAECAPTSASVVIGDDGRSMSIDTLNADDILLAELDIPTGEGATLEEVTCILGRLDTPDSVIARMDSTRALDGMQEATWDGFAAVWTYHPDDGLSLIIEQAR